MFNILFGLGVAYINEIWLRVVCGGAFSNANLKWYICALAEVVE